MGPPPINEKTANTKHVGITEIAQTESTIVETFRMSNTSPLNTAGQRMTVKYLYMTPFLPMAVSHQA